MNRNVLLALAALLAAAAGVWAATRPEPPSDEALIRALFEDGARAAEARRPADAVAGVSEAFRGNGLGRRELKQLIAGHALRGGWLAVKLTGTRVVVVGGDAATADLGIVLSRGGPGGAVTDLLPEQASAFRVETRLAREPDGWRVVEASWRQVSLAEALDVAEEPAR